MQRKRTYHFEKKGLILIMVLLFAVGSLHLQLLAEEETCEHSVTDIKREDEIAPGCTEPGGYSEIVYCVNCNAELSRQWVEVPVTDHVPGDVVRENEVSATCTATGSYEEALYCVICGTELSRETVEVPVTDHVPGDVVRENEVPATETAPGSHDEAIYCQTCGTQLSRNTVEDPALMPAADIIEEETAEGTPDVPSGSCGLYGEELLWELDQAGRLIIYPADHGMTGAMDDYQDEINKPAPWYGYRHDIQTVEIGEGVLHIGNNAFRGSDHLETIKIAGSVTSIGEYAFYDCGFLRKVEYAGTDLQWDAIDIKDNNPALSIAEIQYALAVEEEPAAEPAAQPDQQTEADIVQTQITYMVSFDTNGHAFTVDPQIIAEGEKAVLPDDPGEEGYGFGGWFREAECISEWNFDTDTVTEDMTLYAKWLKAPVLTAELIFNDEEQMLITSADEGTWIRIDEEEENAHNANWILVEGTAERTSGLCRMDAGTYTVYWYYGNEAPAEEETGILVGQVVIAKADAVVIEAPEANYLSPLTSGQ